MANNLNEKILFQRARTSQGLPIKSNPYKLKSATEAELADKRGVLVIDPNSVVDKYGQIVDRYVKQEDLTIYASLKVIKKADTAVVSHSGGGVDADGNIVEPTISAAEVSKAIYVNFLNPLKNKKRADGTYERKGKYTTEWTDFFTSDSANDKSSEKYIIDAESFGLHDISIAVNANHLPIIKITFTDVQGRMLFERGNDPDSPYNIFFTYPYPKFYLTYKGYFGRAMEIPMYLLKSNTRFMPESGDYQVTAEFQSEMFGLFNTFLIIYAYVAPYMFITESGEYLGKQILNKLYEKQNAEIEQYLADEGTSNLFSQYKIDKSPSLYDLSRAVKIIPSSAFDIGDNDMGKKDENIIKIKSAIETYQKSINSFFNNIANYTTVVDKAGNVIYKPTKAEFCLTTNKNPVEFYNAIDSLNKLITEVIEIDSFIANKVKNYESGILKLKTFIKNDVYISNQAYKSQVETASGSIIKDTMFFISGETILDVTNENISNVQYVTNNFDRVIIELLNQISYMQNIIENSYIDQEVAELATYLGYEPNLNNVLRIISNNMQTFLILMEVMGKNALKQLQADPKRRKIHETRTDHVKSGKETHFTAYPNYYKLSKKTLSDGRIVDQKVLAYPGIDSSNQDWFEVLFVEEIYKALKTIKALADPKSITGIEKKFTSLLTIFGLGDLDLDVYKNKNTATTIISEAVSKYLLYTNYSGIMYRGIDSSAMQQIGLSIGQYEIDIMNKTIFNSKSTEDNSRIRLDAFDFVKNKDTFIDPAATGIKNSKSNNVYTKYTNLGNLAINGINVQFNGSKDSTATVSTDTEYGTISIYSKLKEFVNTESGLYGKNYTESELRDIIYQRKKYVEGSIQNIKLYQNITFGKVSSPLKYSLSLVDGKSNNLTVYPDLISNLNYYSDITKSGNFDVVNNSLSAVSESNYDNNPFQGLFQKLNEKLKNDALLNSDMTRNVILGKSTVSALTHNTKDDDIASVFPKVTKPSTNYQKLFKEL